MATSIHSVVPPPFVLPETTSDDSSDAYSSENETESIKFDHGVILSSLPLNVPTNAEQIITKAMNKGCILFGQDCDPLFAFLDNDFPSRFEFGGRNYECATAAYEAQKFFHRPDFMDQFTTLDAQSAFALSAEKHLEKHPSWYEKREETMSHVLRAKFGQNPTVLGFLLLTADAYLSFHTEFKNMDPFWTDDADGSGANRLGHLLMMIRQEYGGAGKGEIPTNYNQFISQREVKKTMSALDKSDEEILKEIDDLNQKINDEDYQRHSQIARRKENLAFTRFPTNNFPYDDTLVPLSSGRYINASFVLGKEFIGTQSPMPQTTEDFWSMVLEYNVSIVIMLNRQSDPGDEIYFPFSLGDKKKYGKIHLELLEDPFFKTDPSWRQSPHEEEPHAIIHRKVKIWQEHGNSVRFVHHFQYQNWRDFSPGNERATAYLVKTVEAYRDQTPTSPIVVHCHAGVGRASVIITLLNQFKHLLSGNVNVKQCVEFQRSPRKGRCHSMMQSPLQYQFCYRTLLLLLGDDYLISTGRLSNTWRL